MSKFKPLATDNSKTGPSEDSIYYRPQSTLTDQYKNARIEQQQKQQRLLSAVNPPNSKSKSKSKIKLQPVRRIAIGGNRNRNNRNTNKPTTLKTNKASTSAQSQLLRNYKKDYSRTQYDTFKKEELPNGTLKCSLFKKSLGCNRAYIGHFTGSKGPYFPKSKIKVNRQDDLQTQLERIQYDKSLNAKRREELIAKLKFGLEDENEKRHSHGGREWWFEFQEAPKPNTNNNNNNKEQKEQDLRRAWLGKPKQKDKNYSYVLMEWTGTTRTATVYPATFIEFGLSTQLVADGEASAESAERRHRQQLANWRKKQAERSMMEKLGNLFGHDEHGNIKEKKKKLRADEITDEAKQKLKEMYMDKSNLSNEEMDMLRDMLGDEQYKSFIEQYKEQNAGTSLQTGDDSSKSLIRDKQLSGRLKSNKRRGQLEELGDYDEFMSDDEDENNLNDYDLIDDEEEDIMSDIDADESENDELFKKLEKNIGEDLANKEYELPEKQVKNGLFDNDSDDDNVDDVAWTMSESDDDDENDMDGNVTIKSKKKNDKKGNANGENNNGKLSNPKKRKMEHSGKGGPSKKKRKLGAVSEQKLKDELTILITTILKKHVDGLEMLELWRKIIATLSAEQTDIKKVLPTVLRALAKQKGIGGKKRYCLKDKYK